MVSKSELIKKGLTLIPVSDLDIKPDSKKTVGYDFTVSDYYTFQTNDGVFVQDCMAIYIPVDDVSVMDINKKIGVWNNLISPANGSLIAESSQDIVLGIYSITQDNDTTDTQLFKGVPLSKGRYIFNQCIKDYIPINRVVDKKTLDLILYRLSRLLDPEDMIDVLSNIQKLGFNISTKKGFTLGLSDIYSPELEDISKTLDDTYSIKNQDITDSQEVKDRLKKLKAFQYINSGARGNIDQLKQLSFSRGPVADSNNRVRHTIIKNSYVTGLTQLEYFNSGFGTRKGLSDTSQSTGDAGYLTRQLIYSNSFIELISDKDIEKDIRLCDCGTQDGIELHLEVITNNKLDMVKTKKLIKSLVGRHYKIKGSDGPPKLVTEDETEIQNLVGKTIIVRSPIYCQNEKICRVCYGSTYKYLHSTQIGIIASQTLGERLVQLVLRTFHISGSVQKTTKSGSNDDIISGLQIINSIMHRPQTYVKNGRPEELLKTLFHLVQNYGNIYMVHYEIIISAMMWCGNDPWRLVNDRDKYEPTYHSILKIPNMISWLIGVAFASVGHRLLDGLVSKQVDSTTSLGRLFRL